MGLAKAEGASLDSTSMVSGRAAVALENHAAFREGRAPLFYGGTLVWCEPTERKRIPR